MLRTVSWYFMGWTYLVSTIPELLWVKLMDRLGRIQARDRVAQRVSMRGARALFKMTGSELVIQGEENLPKEGTVLFVSNHQGHMDSAIIHGFIRIPKGFVSIIEVKKFPILREWMSYMKCIFLDRDDPRQSLECIQTATEFLKQGHSMVIFPEGKLSDGDEVGEFKNGSLRLALKAGVPILPLAISGSYRTMTKNGSRVKPARVELSILPLIDTRNIDRNGEKELMQQVRNTIISAGISARE